MSETHYRKKIVKKTQKDNFVTVFFSKLGHSYLNNAPELLKLCHFCLCFIFKIYFIKIELFDSFNKVKK